VCLARLVRDRFYVEIETEEKSKIEVKTMYYLAAVLGAIFGALIMLIFFLIMFKAGYWRRKQRHQYQEMIDQYLNAERVIHAHIRAHVLRDKDFSWAVGVAPIVTFGIKPDYSLMSDEELGEARRMAEVLQAEEEKGQK